MHMLEICNLGVLLTVIYNAAIFLCRYCKMIEFTVVLCYAVLFSSDSSYLHLISNKYGYMYYL